MEPLAVDLLVLRSLLTPGVRISPGRALMARVVRAEGSERGALSIAGEVIDAKLPKHLRAGQDVRLVVQSVTANSVVMSLSDQTPVPIGTPPVPLAERDAVHVEEREEPSADSSEGGTHVVSLRYQAPTLGPIDLRFELDATALRVVVALAPGEPLRRAEAESAALLDALQAKVERTVSVKVSPRREPLDLYA